jgi:hypothetical protein
MARAFLEWSIGLMGRGQWNRRRAQLVAQLAPGGVLQLPGPPTTTTPSVVPRDLPVWYLLQVERWLEDAASYDVLAGSRVMPIVQRLGHALSALDNVDGAADRYRRVLRQAHAEIDSVLFEMLVALAYAERSGESVAFIPQTSDRTPDLRVGPESDPFLVECKRKFRTNRYVREEYRRFAALYHPVREELKRLRLSWGVDFLLHRELATYPYDYLARRVVPNLALGDATIGIWRTLIDDDDMRVAVRAADWERYRRELAGRDVRGDTPQLHHILFGYDEPWRGYEPSVGGVPSEQSPGLFARVGFACVGVWSCDAPESVQAKTRHHQAELRDAFGQLPAAALGAVHVGAETYDDDYLTEERRRRIDHELWDGLDATRRERQWVYVHYLAFDVPPDTSWSTGETCIYFAPRDADARRRELNPRLLLQPATPFPEVGLIRHE